MRNAITLDFVEVYRKNLFEGTESVSGPGSSRERTAHLRNVFTSVLTRFAITSLLDIPCGDLNWMWHVPLDGIRYIGTDIVPELITRNEENFGVNKSFVLLDLRSDSLPQVDLIFCRDCFVHMPFADIVVSLANIKKSKSKWLLTTSFPTLCSNVELESGVWRPLNLQKAPFNLPVPEKSFFEAAEVDCTAPFSDKSVALRAISEL